MFMVGALPGRGEFLRGKPSKIGPQEGVYLKRAELMGRGVHLKGLRTKEKESIRTFRGRRAERMEYLS